MLYRLNLKRAWCHFGREILSQEENIVYGFDESRRAVKPPWSGDCRWMGEPVLYLYTHILACTQTQTHILTYTNTQIQTQTHKHTNTQTHKQTNTQTHKHTHTQTQKHKNTQIHKHTNTHTLLGWKSGNTVVRWNHTKHLQISSSMIVLVVMF